MGNRENPEGCVIIGQIGAPYGVRGWVRVRSFTQSHEGILDYSVWQLLADSKWNEYELLSSAKTGSSITVNLKGIDNRTAASKLVGNLVGVGRNELPPIGRGEHYWVDLIKMKVFNQQGVLLGIVNSLIDTGANDVLSVRGERERLIPFIDSVIMDVSHEKGSITVDWEVDY